jgi:lipid II isoglutaminyl synthase (glutamine-hydrolysing)
MRISLGYLYPDVMSTYGDRGNVDTVLRRCDWRDVAVDVKELRLGDRVEPDTLDLIMIGGGGESQQRLVAADLYKLKGAAIRDAVAQGAAALAVGGGYELFGRFCQPGEGAEIPGVELFDSWTIWQSTVIGDHYGTISQARADRVIGQLVVRWRGSLLVGFENHGGGTYLGPTAKPLGQVLSGHGNNGDGTEGVVLGSAIGTHLRGPCLPRNPVLADFLIGAALSRRYGAADLAPLADELERAAHEVAIRRAYAAARATRGKLRRAAFAQARLARLRQARAGLAGPRLNLSAQRGRAGATGLRAGTQGRAQLRPAARRPAPLLPDLGDPQQIGAEAAPSASVRSAKVRSGANR